MENELAESRLLTSKVLLKIKGIFLEALAKMMGTPQVSPGKQLIATKLVLREVEVKTPGNAGTGGKFEHPTKDKIDFNNPIVKVFCGGNYYFNFGSKNGDTTQIKSSQKFKDLSIEPIDSMITKIVVNYDNSYIANLKFYNKENECVLMTDNPNYNNN